jgi:hypothetical protein
MRFFIAVFGNAGKGLRCCNGRRHLGVRRNRQGKQSPLRRKWDVNPRRIGLAIDKNRKPAGGELKMKTMSLVIVVLSLGIFGANAAEPNKIVPTCWEENVDGQVERHCEVRRDNGEIISTPTPFQRAQPSAPPSPTPPPPQQVQTSSQQTPPQSQRLQIYGPGFYVYVGPDGFVIQRR